MSTTGSAVGQVKELKMMKVDETAVKEHIDKIVRGTVEETLNQLLQEEAARYAVRADMSTASAGRTQGPVSIRGSLRRGLARSSLKFRS